MNAQCSHNEVVSSSGSPYKKSINIGVNIQTAYPTNHPAQMGGHNENNRDDMSQISDDIFDNIIN